MSRVLIVDDEADIRELLSMTLQRMGLETDCAANEFEAVQLLQKCSYELCLTDMRLPDGDGLKLLEHVNAHYAATPVAVINRLHEEFARAVAQPDVRERLAGVGARPVGSTPEALGTHIRNELARWPKVINAAGIRIN